MKKRLIQMIRELEQFLSPNDKDFSLGKRKSKERHNYVYRIMPSVEKVDRDKQYQDMKIGVLLRQNEIFQGMEDRRTGSSINLDSYTYFQKKNPKCYTLKRSC